MKKINLKDEKGALSADAYIAILILVLFAGLIATLIYNIHIATARVERTSQANSYIVEIFEYIDKLYYSEVTEEKIVEYIDYKYNNAINSEKDETISDVNIASARNTTGLTDTQDTSEILTTPYKIEISIEKYNDEFDLVKTITITVKYNIGNKEQSLTMQRAKIKEVLRTPNEANLEDLIIEEGKSIYPIKYVEGKWYVTDSQTDTEWYNYEAGYWATVFVSSENFEEGDQILANSLGDYYIWIPKYAYSNSDIKFLYEKTNKYVNENGNLEDLQETYSLGFSESFKDKNGAWINTYNIESQELYTEYSILESYINRNNI